MTAPDLTARVRPRADVLMRDLEGEAVIVELTSGRYFGLDEIGTDIWRWIEEHQQLSAVHEAMTTRYEVAAPDAERDLLQLVGELLEAGLLEPVVDA